MQTKQGGQGGDWSKSVQGKNTGKTENPNLNKQHL